MGSFLENSWSKIIEFTERGYGLGERKVYKGSESLDKMSMDF